MIGFLLSKFRNHKFKKQWRLLNEHNETIPINHFPIEKVTVGNFTYGGLKVEVWGSPEEGLAIGSYCSIAAGVSFLLGGNHRIDGLLTFPSKVKILKIAKEEAVTKGKIIVEDDVWIGTGATILSGVRIGKGSVIGAGSLVSRNIEPYSIVVGSPAKLVKKRFNEDVIDYLLSIDYSKLNFQKFDKSNAEELYSKIDTIDEAKNLISKLTN